jgi:hypothetical protein
MPMSLDPQLADDETECARCGARIYIGLTRCPNCGVNLYAPDDEGEEAPLHKSNPARPPKKGLFERLDDFFHWLTRRPYPVSESELFAAGIQQAELFDTLLVKVGGDRPTVERLIDLERQKLPEGNRTLWLENAIESWDRDNRG